MIARLALCLLLLWAPITTAAESPWQWQLTAAHGRQDEKTVSIVDMTETETQVTHWNLCLAVHYAAARGFRLTLEGGADAISETSGGWNFNEAAPRFVTNQRSLQFHKPSLQLLSPPLNIGLSALQLQVKAQLGTGIRDAALIWQTLQDPLLIRGHLALLRHGDHWTWGAQTAVIFAAHHRWHLGWQAAYTPHLTTVQTDLIHDAQGRRTQYSFLYGLQSSLWKTQVTVRF